MEAKYITFFLRQVQAKINICDHLKSHSTKIDIPLEYYTHTLIYVDKVSAECFHHVQFCVKNNGNGFVIYFSPSTHEMVRGTPIVCLILHHNDFVWFPICAYVTYPVVSERNGFQMFKNNVDTYVFIQKHKNCYIIGMRYIKCCSCCPIHKC